MFAIFIIYLFNKMALVLDIYIPINLINVLIVDFLGIPGLVMLIILYYIVL